MAHEIIGRGDELSAVQAFFDRPVDGLRALVLAGEAGIGQSTIWQASVAAARERSWVAQPPGSEPDHREGGDHHLLSRRRPDLHA